MTKVIATADLHQHPAKWELLVSAIVEQKPDTVLIAGDLPPKEVADYFFGDISIHRIDIL